MFENIIKNLRDKLFHESEYELSDEEQGKKEYFEKNILSQREFGDYICAIKDDMNFTDTEERVCPYIVIGKTEDKLIACRVTKNPKYRDAIIINKDDEKNASYILYKDRKAIDYVSYRHSKQFFNKSLTDEEKKKLKNSLIFLGENIFYKDLGQIKEFTIDTKQEFSQGDIISDCMGIPALIIDKNESGNYICISINNYDPKTNKINFIDTEFDFHKRFTLYKRNYNYFGSIPNNQLVVVLKKYSDYMKQINEFRQAKKSSILIRGAVIRRMNEYYYVNAVEAKKAKLISLKPANKEDKDALCLGNIYFIPDYQKTSEINENDLYSTIIKLSSEKEMDDLKKDKKSKSKIQKEQLKKLDRKAKENKVSLNDGDIIENNKYFKMKFIVLGFYEDTIITISLDDFKEGKTSVYEFYIKDKAISLCENIDLKDRAIVEFNQDYLFGLYEDICDKKDEQCSRLILK